MSSSSACSSGSELTDYDSSSSLEVFVTSKKLKEELKKELEKEKKVAAEKGLPTYGDGTRQKFDKKGRLRNEQIVRLERINNASFTAQLQQSSASPGTGAQLFRGNAGADLIDWFPETEKRRSMRAQVMKNIAMLLHRPCVRQAYNFFTREIPPENDLNSDLTRRKIHVTADEDTMRVTIIRSPPLPY